MGVLSEHPRVQPRRNGEGEEVVLVKGPGGGLYLKAVSQQKVPDNVELLVRAGLSPEAAEQRVRELAEGTYQAISTEELQRKCQRL